MQSLHNKSVSEIENKVKTMHDEKEVISRANFELQFGVSRVIGGRKHQEDEYTCVDYLSKKKGPALFAVFDGHGTDDYAAVASNTLHTLILQSPLFKAGQYREAIRKAYADEDKFLCEKMGGKRGGSTSTVAVIVGDELYIGHLGDSRAVLAIEEKLRVSNVSSAPKTVLRTARISRDHKPDDPDERKRILAAGGVVLQGRVIGKDSAINTSRALGDYDFKLPRNEAIGDFVSSQPYLPEPIVISPSCKFMILASDGLWNQMDERTVTGIIDELWRGGASPTSIADTLTSKLGGPDGIDNVTVIVVFFMWDGSRPVTDRYEAHTDEVLVSQHESKVAP